MASALPVNSDIAIVVGELPKSAGTLAAVARFQRIDTHLRDITDALRRSPDVCTQLVAAANGFYRGEGEVEDVDQAVARLGYRDAFSLIGALVWRKLCKPCELYGVGPDELWRSGLFTGLLMAQLAPAANLDGRAAFLAGLFRSVGKVVLNDLARRTAEMPPYTEGEETLPQWEENLLGYMNTDIAAAALELWKFPIEVGTAVRCHYALDQTTPVLARLLNIAAGEADLRGHGFRGEEEFWRITPELLAACGLDRESLSAASAITATEFQRVVAAIEAPAVLRTE